LCVSLHKFAIYQNYHKYDSTYRPADWDLSGASVLVATDVFVDEPGVFLGFCFSPRFKNKKDYINHMGMEKHYENLQPFQYNYEHAL